MHTLLKLNFVILICILLFSFSPVLRAQTPFNDSCKNLRYHSGIEVEGFKTLCTGMIPDYLAMAVAVNQTSGSKELNTIRKTIKNEASVLKTQISEIKKPAKKLKYVFDHVQSTFLKQYDLDAGFSEMFETGKYNCLTATILYTLLLDELSIKHTIKFMPGHVYLIAYADEIPYIFETTDPLTGFVELNNTVQRKAIQSLRLMQFMASDNGKSQSAGNLFDRYYIKLNNTEMKGLIGYQYTNLAVAMMLKQNFLSAYDQLTKAIILTPMDELVLMQEEILKQAILQTNKTTVRRAELLVSYYNSTKFEDKKNLLVEEFKQSIYLILFSSFPSPDSLLPVYNTLYNGIKDEDVRKVLEDTYTDSYLDYLRIQEKEDEAFEFIYKLYVGGNKSSYVKGQMQLSINSMSEKMRYKNDALGQYDTLAAHFPALMDFEIFKYNRCHEILSNAGGAFRLKDIKEGERLLDMYDKGGYFNEKSLYACNPAWVYSLAGSCYFKMGNQSKARATLKKGLTFDPDNFEIKKKLSELK